MNKFDIKDIQDKFNRIVKYSQNLDETVKVKSNQLFEDWKTNKSVFYNAWDGNLIKELGTFTFHLSEEQRNHTVNNIINAIENLYNESTVGYLDFQFDSLVSFILDNQANFFDNEVKEDYHFKDIVIPKGMKILRAFKYFCKDKDMLNEIQSIASMAIQNDKVTGTLCMSVHPLDYLSVSENAHNWRSCHALDGEYRAGNLNYMADATTVVCYLKSSHKAELPHFPPEIKWNSKKWRVLLFFDETYDFMMAGRQYPFFENSLLLYIRREVERMFHTKFSGWFDKYYTYDKLTSFLDDKDNNPEYEFAYRGRYIPVGGKLLRLSKLVQDDPGTLQFNDLLNSSSYTEPYYSFELQQGWTGKYFNVQKQVNIIPKIRVGKKCTCLECGKKDITMSESFLCNHCMLKEGQAFDKDIFAECYWCNNLFVSEEGDFIDDGYGIMQPTCPDCLNNVKTCDRCNHMVHESVLENGLCPICRGETD